MSDHGSPAACELFITEEPSVWLHCPAHWSDSSDQKYRSYSCRLAVLLEDPLSDFVIASNIEAETVSIKFPNICSEQRGVLWHLLTFVMLLSVCVVLHIIKPRKMPLLNSSLSWSTPLMLLQAHKNCQNMTEIEAKVSYVKLARSLKTYGVSFFLVKVRRKLLCNVSGSMGVITEAAEWSWTVSLRKCWR